MAMIGLGVLPISVQSTGRRRSVMVFVRGLPLLLLLFVGSCGGGSSSSSTSTVPPPNPNATIRNLHAHCDSDCGLADTAGSPHVDCRIARHRRILPRTATILARLFHVLCQQDLYSLPRRRASSPRKRTRITSSASAAMERGQRRAPCFPSTTRHSAPRLDPDLQ